MTTIPRSEGRWGLMAEIELMIKLENENRRERWWKTRMMTDEEIGDGGLR
jgi:hypothetical protein